MSFYNMKQVLENCAIYMRHNGKSASKVRYYNNQMFCFETSRIFVTKNKTIMKTITVNEIGKRISELRKSKIILKMNLLNFLKYQDHH